MRGTDSPRPRPRARSAHPHPGHSSKQRSPASWDCCGTSPRMLAHTPPPRTLRPPAARGCFGARPHRLHPSPPPPPPRTLRSPASKVLWRAPARAAARAAPSRRLTPPQDGGRSAAQGCGSRARRPGLELAAARCPEASPGPQLLLSGW